MSNVWAACGKHEGLCYPFSIVEFYCFIPKEYFWSFLDFRYEPVKFGSGGGPHRFFKWVCGQRVGHP